jgi:hypothetical protein
MAVLQFITDHLKDVLITVFNAMTELMAEV